MVVVTASPETKNTNRRALVRGVHTLIYVVMAASTLMLVYAGLTGAEDWWLWVALALLGAYEISNRLEGARRVLKPDDSDE